MAYVDLVSTGVTPVQSGSTYNFSYDTPISADGSPHITHIGFQIDGKVAAGPTFTSGGIGNLISNYRIKIGANTILNFDDTAAYAADSALKANISCIAAKVGGWDACTETADGVFVGELTLPFGLDATRSHRVNVSITLGSESTWCGKAFDVANTEFNMVHFYGTAADQTLYGSRQDFTLTNGAERTLTVYGKTGWQMLGLVYLNDQSDDEVSKIRPNNGSFRALTLPQWRVLDSTYTQGIQDTKPDSNVWSAVLSKGGFIFLDLKRLTAGADISLSFTATADSTASLYPVWVAPIAQNTGGPVRQTQKTVSSTARDVESESKY